MQLILLLCQVEVHPAADAVHAPGRPLLQDLAHAHDSWVAAHQDIEVAGKSILQGGELEELLHQLIRVDAPLQVDGQLQAGQVRLIPHVVDLPDLAGLDQLCHLVNDGFRRGGIGNLVDFYNIFLGQIAPAGADLEAAPAGAVNVLHGRPVIDDLTAGGKVRRGHGGEQVMLRVPEIIDGGLADLAQVKAADLAGHAHGNAHVGGNQHIGKSGGQQAGLLHAAVIVIHEVHRVLVDVPEHLAANAGQLGLGITGGCIGHIPGIDLAEVALGVHKRHQQRLIARGETYHSLIDGRVAMGVQLHGLAHNIGAFGASAGQKSHLEHGVQQLAMGGLEAVDLRDGTGDNDAHGIGHIVGLQGLGDGLFQHLGPQTHHVGIVVILFFLGFLLSHFKTRLPEFTVFSSSCQ